MQQPLKRLSGFVFSIGQWGSDLPSQRERLRDNGALGSLPSHYQHVSKKKKKSTVLLNHFVSSFLRHFINTQVWCFAFTLQQQLGIDMENTYYFCKIRSQTT